MIWKFLKQNVLFPKGLNWVQHWVSRIGLFGVISATTAFWVADLKQFINWDITGQYSDEQWARCSLFWREVLGDHPHSGCLRVLHGYGGPQVHVGEVTCRWGDPHVHVISHFDLITFMSHFFFSSSYLTYVGSPNSM